MAARVSPPRLDPPPTDAELAWWRVKKQSIVRSTVVRCSWLTVGMTALLGLFAALGTLGHHRHSAGSTLANIVPMMGAGAAAVMLVWGAANVMSVDGKRDQHIRLRRGREALEETSRRLSGAVKIL